MKISRCYEILDLPEDATMKDLKEAYRDAMSVWHPDRFSGNPRLRRKAEKKAAQINWAYEAISAHLARVESRRVGARSEDGRSAASCGEGVEAGKIERAAEAGTIAVLHVGHAVYSVLRKLTSPK